MNSVVRSFVPPATTEAENEDIALRFYRAVNNGRIESFGDFMAADFVDHHSQPGRPAGLAGVVQEMRELTEAFPDLRIENDLVIAKGDLVTVISTSRGTHRGPLMGIAPTGKRVEIGSIDVFRVRNGMLVEAWHVEQLLQMMMQLGALDRTG
ncbi:MAG: ester cyclase [Bauldia sp.]|nr:ester cyclase [Bauldia sp.]